MVFKSPGGVIKEKKVCEALQEAILKQGLRNTDVIYVILTWPGYQHLVWSPHNANFQSLSFKRIFATNTQLEQMSNYLLHIPQVRNVMLSGRGQSPIFSLPSVTQQSWSLFDFSSAASALGTGSTSLAPPLILVPELNRHRFSEVHINQNWW